MARLFPRKARAKSSAVDLSSDEETLPVKTNGKTGKKGTPVKVKLEVEEKVITKRKSVVEFEAEPDGSTEGAKKPAAKKRKTKAEKAEDNMPLAARTAIASMKRAMYIGAHVSGAGGPPLTPSCFGQTSRSKLTPPRCSQLGTKRCQHRGELVCTLSEVPEKVGESTASRRA